MEQIIFHNSEFWYDQVMKLQFVNEVAEVHLNPPYNALSQKPLAVF